MKPPLTDVYENEKEIAQTRFGMAFWAGTGPRGKKCKHCLHWEKDGRYERWRCGKYRQMMGKVGGLIPADVPACKYFEQNKKALP